MLDDLRERDRPAAVRVLADTIRGFVRDDCPEMAAGIAFYTLFSLAPLLVIVVHGVSLVIDPDAFVAHVERTALDLVGPAGAEQVHTILHATVSTGANGRLASIVSSIVVFLGATTVLVQLQNALNRVWHVHPEPGQSTFRHFLVKRVVSLVMLALIACLLVASLASSALVAAASSRIGALLPEHLRAWASGGTDLAVTFAVFWLVFSAMFKYLPDACVQWRHVIGGGFVTSALFVLGKSLIGWYMRESAMASFYGAAGSLAVVLAWVYYTALLVLFGAELTRSWAAWLGERVEPEDFALPDPEPTAAS